MLVQYKAAHHQMQKHILRKVSQAVPLLHNASFLWLGRVVALCMGVVATPAPEVGGLR